VLFPNICSEILCLFLLESSDGIVETPKRFVWTKTFFLTLSYFHYWDPKLKAATFVDISTFRAKSTLENGLFEFLCVLR
jgi:hypothetical protein